MKYAKFLSSALRESLEELQAQCFGAISLRDELAIFQHFAREALTRYDRAKNEYVAEEDPKKKLALLSVMGMAQDQVEHSVHQVKDLALAASKLEYDERTLGVGVVHGMLATICQYVENELTDQLPEKAAQIMLRIGTRARQEMLTLDSLTDVYTENSTGSLAPAQMEAKLMDDTVPGEEAA